MDKQPTHVFGHKNPDTDSVVSATALSYLKNKLGGRTLPYRLGDVNKETIFVYNRFQVPIPPLLQDVKAQVSDLDYEKPQAMRKDHSIAHAYRHMQETNVRTLPIVDDHKQLLGVMTMYDVAMHMITGTEGDPMKIVTNYDNMLYTIEGRECVRSKEEINGLITVTAYHTQTIINEKILHAQSIVIVGDRHEIIQHALDVGVELIIVTGGKNLPPTFREEALKKKINIIITHHDTYQTTRLMALANRIESIMKTENLVKIVCSRYLEDVREILEKSKHSKFPIVDEHHHYQGILSRRDILRPNRKKVILVDHNEFHQSVEGIQEAQVLEIIDHHKIGSIATMLPINFRNETVGSTSTIIYDMFKEKDTNVPDHIAGLLLSAILSDTLFFKSPTTTKRDKKNAQVLANMLSLDLAGYAKEMFQAGTSIADMPKEDIFYNDYKEFDYKSMTLGISQFLTLDIKTIQDRKDEIFSMMHTARIQRNLGLVLVIITDIIKEGSYLYYDTAHEAILTEAFKLPQIYQGLFVPKLISRKKQIIPSLLEGIDLLEII